jgi:hypothetical protein
MVSPPKDNGNREKYNTERLFHTSRVVPFIWQATLHVIKTKLKIDLHECPKFLTVFLPFISFYPAHFCLKIDLELQIKICTGNGR